MKQIKSKKRVKDFGEVYTQEREVKAMLDLVKEESYQIDSLFLEPACGNGNFLVEILKRKLSVCQSKEEVITSLKSIYAIDILEDNVLESKKRLYELVQDNLTQEEAFFIMERNIICGDSLELLNNSFYMDLKFDVIIGNPPYQLSVPGNKTRAISIYHKFVEKAIDLNPKYISMIIPAKWLSQKSMENFKNKMFNDKKISYLIDYTDAKECFPDIQLEGGVCYFLWNSKPFDYFDYISVINGKETQVSRNLEDDKCDVFIRDILSFQIIEKVSSFNEISFKEGMSGTKPFGLETNYLTNENHESNNILLYVNQKMGGVKYIKEKDVKKNKNLIGKYKVLISKGYGAKGIPSQVINKPILAGKNSCCTETYIIARVTDTKEEAENVATYMQTKFFRFLVLLNKPTQDALKGVYSLVPEQDFSKPWTDAELYEKYGLTQEEIDYIESMIRPME